MWNEILKIGRDLGFHDLGLASYDSIMALRPLLEARRARGWELSIEEEDLDARLDPRLSLASCRSVIVAFIQTPLPKGGQGPSPGHGGLAAMSRGRDYHQVLRERLEELEGLLSLKFPGLESLIQVDTGPLMERSLALASGRGSLGKNGAFIHQDLGSYVALGLLLTNLDLGEGGSFMGSLCGDCRACIDACPGGAILEEGGLNPQVCRSWLTQKKGDLTDKEARVLGSSLYGCDICQLVCPLNKGIRQEDESIWGDQVSQVDLSLLEGLSNKEFKRTFGHIAGAWRGKRVWARNARIILKNQGKRGP